MTLLQAPLENGASESSVQAFRPQPRATWTDASEEAVTGGKDALLQELLPCRRPSPPPAHREPRAEIKRPSLRLLDVHLGLFKTILQEIPYTYPRMTSFGKCPPKPYPPVSPPG